MWTCRAAVLGIALLLGACAPQKMPVIHHHGFRCDRGAPFDLPTLWALAPDGTVKGRVIDDDGEPVRAAVVQLTLTDRGESPTRRALSGADGSFTFTAIEPSSFRASVSRLGFYTVQALVEIGPDTARETELRLARSYIC
jgi:hypothetical protein